MGNCIKKFTLFDCYLIYIYFQNNADILFGGVTIVCGVFGTVGGSYVLDFMGATISNAFKVDTCILFILWRSMVNMDVILVYLMA